MISKQLIRNRLRPQLARRQSVNKTRSFRVQPAASPPGSATPAASTTRSQAIDFELLIFERRWILPASTLRDLPSSQPFAPPRCLRFPACLQHLPSPF